MHYPKELAFYKAANFQHPPGLQTFAEPPPPGKFEIEVQLLQRMLNFCQDCIHGISYIWEPDTRRGVRLFWLSVAMMALGGCIAMYTILTTRLHDQVLVTMVESPHLPIYSIHFPSVAVCPFNHVNWIRYKAAEVKFLPNNANENERQIFYDLLKVMEDITFTLLSPIGDLVRRKTIPPIIQKISLYDLAQFMAFRCDELFVSCVYDETPYDCCKIFVPERTERGICLVFNSLISKESKIRKLTDNFYPWRVRMGGETSSLSFTLRYNKTLFRPGSTTPFAFSILVKESEEWGDSVFHLLYPNTYNRVMVTPIMIETSSNTRGINPQKRKCLFADEISAKYDRIAGLPHNKLNCETRCKANYVLKYCNCTLSMFFPQKAGSPKRECRVSDLECIFQHRDVFNYFKAPQQDKYINDSRRGMVCDCIDNCLALLFLIEMNTNILTNASEHTPEIKANIFYLDSVLTKYITRMEYTSMDLLANFGGIVGLCLGASALSLVEILYIIIRTVLVLIIMKWKQKRKQRRVRDVKSLNDIEK